MGLGGSTRWADGFIRNWGRGGVKGSVSQVIAASNLSDMGIGLVDGFEIRFGREAGNRENLALAIKDFPMVASVPQIPVAICCLLFELGVRIE
jgi:hypothetical protein